MKKIFVVFALLTSMGVMAQQQHQTPLVTVTGKGTVTVVPDRVLIQARIEHTGKSASEVKEQNDRVVNEVIRYLKSQDVPSKNIQTEFIRLNKEYNYNSKETSYSANQAISIQLEDLSKYETIMSGLLQSGLNRIDGIRFQSSKRTELEAEARKKAVQDARQKATEYAGALDQRIGKAQQISEMGSYDPQPAYRMMEMQSDSREKETIAPGELEITVKVNVSFILY